MDCCKHGNENSYSRQNLQLLLDRASEDCCMEQKQEASWLLPIAMVARSRACACGRSLAGFARSNPARVMDVCDVCMLYKDNSMEHKWHEEWGRDVKKAVMRLNSILQVPGSNFAQDTLLFLYYYGYLVVFLSISRHMIWYCLERLIPPISYILHNLSYIIH